MHSLFSMAKSTLSAHRLVLPVSLGFALLVAARCEMVRADDPPAAEPGANAETVFRQRVVPLLVSRCLACHGGDKTEGGYSLKTMGELLKAGDSERTPITAGRPDESELFRRLVTSDPSERMPAESEPLSAEEIELFRKWIVESRSFANLAADKELAEWLEADMNRSRAADAAGRAVPITAVAISSDSKRVIASGYGEVIEWNIDTNSLSRRYPIPASRITAIDLSPNDELLLAAGGEPGERGVVFLLALGKESKPLAAAAFSDVTTALAFSPDGKRAAIGGPDGSLLFLDSASGSVEQRMTPHADVITALAWSADGKRLITSSRDRTARVFDTEKMELIASYDRHERAVGGVSWGEAGPTSLDETGRLRLWSGTDNDQSKAEQSGLPRFLERYVSRGPGIFLADRGDVRHFRIDSKKVDDGKDDKGQPKTKTVTRFAERPRFVSKQPKWILSLDLSEDLLVAGTESGQIILWDKKGDDEPRKVDLFAVLPK